MDTNPGFGAETWAHIESMRINMSHLNRVPWPLCGKGCTLHSETPLHPFVASPAMPWLDRVRVVVRWHWDRLAFRRSHCACCETVPPREPDVHPESRCAECKEPRDCGRHTYG